MSLPEGGGGQASCKRGSDGYLSSCTAEIGNSVASRGGSDAFVTILHEAGHCLGLTHSVVSGAIMSYRPGNDLNSDDRYAVSLLYPRNSSPAYPMGCAAVHQNSSPKEKWDGLLSTLMLAMILVVPLIISRLLLHSQ